MKKVISSLAIAAVITLGFANVTNAQDVVDAPDPNAAVVVDDNPDAEPAEPAAAGPSAEQAGKGEKAGAEEETKKKDLI